MSQYNWQKVTIPTLFTPSVMLLMTDGSVLVLSYYSNQWQRLTPDRTGHYENGNWSAIPPMSVSRLFFSSGILKDGRAFVLGGEYVNGSTTANDGQVGEIYDPSTNQWSFISKPFNWVQGDASSCVLADGRVLFGGPNVQPGTGLLTAIWDPEAPSNEAWVLAGTGFGTIPNTKSGVANEETWTLLPDGSVLSVELQLPGGVNPGSKAERYVPAIDQWVAAGSPVSNLPFFPSVEMGPAIVLPNGNLFVVGGSGHTGIFNPGKPPASAWSAGPDFEPASSGDTLNSINGNLKTAMDAPCCLLTNGKVLVLQGNPYQAGPVVLSGSPTFYIYDPSTNTMHDLEANGGKQPVTNVGNTYSCCLLPLPTGQVLLSTSEQQLLILTIDPSVNTIQDSWRPIIDSFPSVMIPGHTYTFTGRQLTGLSQATSYGDDLQNATNYPIVRLTTGDGSVYYCPTSNFSSLGIATENTPQTMTVKIPQNAPQVAPGSPGFGSYMEVIANGIPSKSFGVTIQPWNCLVQTARDTFGQGEINGQLKHTGASIIRPAIQVWIEGFTPGDLGLRSVNDLNQDPPSSAPDLTSSIGSKLTFEPYGPILAEDESLPDAPQRFAYQYQANFHDQSTADSIFNSINGDTGAITLAANLNVASKGVSVSAEGSITLTKSPSPFFLKGDPNAGKENDWWLSQDLRVFQIKQGESRYYGLQVDAGPANVVAPDYIGKLLNNLNGDAAANDLFNSIPDTEEASTITIAQTDRASTPVYNFCVARVRYQDTIPAQFVRVFFRMWRAAQTEASYDPTTLYRTANAGLQEVPLLGIIPSGTEIATIPFFATPRIDSLTNSMTAQNRDDPNIIATMNPAPSGGEVSYFFGAWLDINQPDRRFPVELLGPNPANLPDGPFNGVPNVVSIQELIRGTHQCLIAEIAFAEDPITPNANPSNTDKLAQRNLMINSVANPGVDASRQALVPFEIRATPTILATARNYDELALEWSNVPAGSVVNIFLPSAKASDILALANDIYYSPRLTKIDDNTVSAPAGSGVTYIPIPAQTSKDGFVGLLSLGLPIGIIKGQSFGVTVRQITTGFLRVDPVQVPVVPKILKSPPSKEAVLATSSATTAQSSNVNGISYRRTLGQFHLSVPVSTKSALLNPSTRILSILRYIATSIPATSRWYPVFLRYVDGVTARVNSLGGNAGAVGGDPNGGVVVKSCGEGGKANRYCGVVSCVLYDNCGDFKGFKLDIGCEGEREFDVCRGRVGMRRLVEEVFEKGCWVEVFTDIKGEIVEIGRGRRREEEA